MALSSKPAFVVLVSLLFLIIPCNAVFAERSVFSAAPRSEQNSGLDGVYVHTPAERCGQDQQSHKILQFYDDGIVLSASLCSGGDLLHGWRDIQAWFHRDTDHLEVPRGEYSLSQDQIHFRLTVYDDRTGAAVVVEYSGTYTAQQLVLDVYDHYQGLHQPGQVYLKLQAAD